MIDPYDEDGQDELDAELENAEKLRQFKELLASMSNEQLAKMLLNKTLTSLAVLLEEDMATAADYNVIRAILKDNNIGIVPTRENAMGKLQAKLKEASTRNQGQANIIKPDELTNVDIDDFVQRH